MQGSSKSLPLLLAALFALLSLVLLTACQADVANAPSGSTPVILQTNNTPVPTFQIPSQQNQQHYRVKILNEDATLEWFQKDGEMHFILHANGWIGISVSHEPFKQGQNVYVKVYKSQNTSYTVIIDAPYTTGDAFVSLDKL